MSGNTIPNNTQEISGDKSKTIWIVGSSIIKQAFMRARRSRCVNLDLGRLSASIWWQGYSGLRWGRLEAKLNTLLQVEDIPDILVIHCGGNDIGIGPGKAIELRKSMEKTNGRIS